MARRRVSSGVGRRVLRKLGGVGGCWSFGLEVEVGCLGCFGVLPLRLMGAEDEEAIGRNGRCGDVFLMVWVESRVRCRCHCDFGGAVSVYRFNYFCHVQAALSTSF